MDNNLKKLKKLFAVLDEETLTRTEFVEAFESVVNLVLKVEKKNKEAIEKMEETATDTSNKLEDGNNVNLTDVLDEIKKQTAKMHKDQAVGMNLVRDKLRKLKSGEDGKDADEEKIVKEVLKQIKLPEQKELILDTPESLRNKLETLKGDSRLDKKAIKGLQEFLDGIDKRISNIPRGGGLSGRYVNTPMVDVFTGDGSTKAFTLSKAPKSLDTVKAWGSDFPYIMVNGSDNGFTITGKVLTLGSETDAPSNNARLIVEYYV